MKPAYDILKAPLITEKGTLVSEKGGQVVFKVDPRATKTEIRQAIEQLFQVKVSAVRTASFLGKTVRRGQRIGRKPSWKKAYVTLVEGEIPDLLEKV